LGSGGSTGGVSHEGTPKSSELYLSGEDLRWAVPHSRQPQSAANALAFRRSTM
jgi:hypothetical protein